MRRWGLVFVLVAAYALSFLDRQVLGLLVDGLRRDLRIGDAEVGLLLGPAFGVFYALLGMPCGWLADRMRRTWLIACGLLLWTAATLLSGLATSFPALAAARMLVGVGEAALVPAAVSLIADSFPPERRAMPLAVFTAGISVGAGLALVLGGALVAFASDGAAVIPGLSGRAPWRVVLLVAGAAGVPLALVVALLAEPPRSAVLAGQAAGSLIAHLRKNARLLVPLLFATSLLYIFSNALSAWLPSLFVRRFGWLPQMVGARLGLVVLASALTGTVASGLWAAALARRGRGDASLTVMVAGAALLAPAGLLVPLIGSPGGVIAGLAIVYFAMALAFGVATATLVAVTPAELRGRMVALYLLLGNLAGLGLGPPTIGLLLDRALGDPARVDLALALVALPTLVPGVLLLALARRRVRVARAARGDTLAGR